MLQRPSAAAAVGDRRLCDLRGAFQLWGNQSGAGTLSASQRALTCQQAIIEAERNLAAKLPVALPAFRLIVSRCLQIVFDPTLEELAPHAGRADPEDLPILVSALREGCPWLVSFNLRHFQPGVPAVTVLRPGDFVLRVRDHLSGLTREGA